MTRTVILQAMGLAPPNEHDGCRTYFTAQAQDMAELAAAGTPPVVLLSDGGCTSQRKLQLAVANGAVAVLITLSNLTASVDLAWCVRRVESHDELYVWWACSRNVQEHQTAVSSHSSEGTETLT